MAALSGGDRVAGASADERERFIPVTRFALAESLCRNGAWGDAEDDVRRFFRYLEYWRQQRYAAVLLELERAYEPFSPDTDLVVARKHAEAELPAMQETVLGHATRLLQQANFVQIDARDEQVILTPESHYGLNLDVDLDAFTTLLIYYRGLATEISWRRRLRTLYLWREEVRTPVYKRLFLLFKLKPVDQQVAEVMAAESCSRATAERKVAVGRATLPPHVKSHLVFMKLFKNVPTIDMEMCFPNTRLRLRLFEKLTFGFSAGGGLAGTASHLAFATNPLLLLGAVASVVGIAFRQLVKFINRRQRYMAKMAQNLYFHAMGDNRAAMTLLADLATEQDVKEDMLLYAAIATGDVHVRDLPRVDADIERYLHETFGVDANFEIEDALPRLVADGIVAQAPDGRLTALPPDAAARQIDALWDVYLDELAIPSRSPARG